MKKLSKSLQINKATIANLTGAQMSNLLGGGPDDPTGDTGTRPTGDTTTEQTWDTIWGGCSEAHTHCEGCESRECSIEYSACNECEPTVTGEETIVPPCEG